MRAGDEHNAIALNQRRLHIVDPVGNAAVVGGRRLHANGQSLGCAIVTDRELFQHGRRRKLGREFVLANKQIRRSRRLWPLCAFNCVCVRSSDMLPCVADMRVNV